MQTLSNKHINALLLLLWLLPAAYFGVRIAPTLLQKPVASPNLFGQSVEVADSLRRNALAQPDFDTFYQSGVAYHNVGMLQAAINDLQQAVSYNPNSAMAYYKLCVVQNETGQNEAAAQNCRKALQLHPNFILAKYRLNLAESEINASNR